MQDKDQALRNSRHLEEQRHMETEALDVAMLCCAFQISSMLRKITFEDSSRSKSTYQLAQEGFETYGAGNPWRCHVFQAVLQAVGKADRSLEVIEDIHKYDEQSVPPWVLNDLEFLLSNTQLIAIGWSLRTFRFDTYSDQYDWGDD